MSVLSDRSDAPDSAADAIPDGMEDFRLPEGMEPSLPNAWRILAHSLARSQTVLDAIGGAVDKSGGISASELAHSARRHQWEEANSYSQISSCLEGIPRDARDARQGANLATAWRCANELERLGDCGRRELTLVLREKEGKFAFGLEERAEIDAVSKRLEEVLYWTLQAMRLRFSNLPRSQSIGAGQIAKREAGVARKVLDVSIQTYARNHEARQVAGLGSIPGGAAFLDFLATVSQAAERLSALLELSVEPTEATDGGEATKS